MKCLITLIFCLSTILTYAQDNFTQATIQGVFSRNNEQIVGLAEAFSEDQYKWRPAEGVRSVGEVLLHVAQANYFILSNLGFETPEDVDMMTLAQVTGKDNIVAEVKKAMDYAQEKIGMVETSKMQDKVELPFGEFTTLSSVLIVLEHSGEHKGQLIAYARSNGITPPWSE